jgi:hypothetical protein
MAGDFQARCILIETSQSAQIQFRRKLAGTVCAEAAILPSVFLLLAEQGQLNPGLDLLEEVLTLQIGTGLVIGKLAALTGPGQVDGAAPDHPVVAEEGAGTVFPALEGVFPFDIAFPHLAVADIEMPGQAVDVLGRDKKGRTGEPVTAVTGAEIAEDSVEGGRRRDSRESH